MADRLEADGWQVLARNFRTTGCELDLIVMRRGILAVVEVKARGGPRVMETLPALLSPRKRRALKRGALAFVTSHSPVTESIRFDLAVVTAGPGGRPEIRLFENVMPESE